MLENADPVHKISIISRGRAAGYTLKLPFEDRKMQSKKQFLDDIAATLGGYVAEEMLFDDVTTGSSNDLSVITAIARDMVMQYGMSEKMGTIAFGERTMGNEPYSEAVAAEDRRRGRAHYRRSEGARHGRYQRTSRRARRYRERTDRKRND